VFDIRTDARINVFATFWEALVGVVTAVFKNQPHDLIATVVPMSGDLKQPQSDILATIGNLLRNAFIRAYLPRFQGTAADHQTITFGPGQVLEPEATK
jgi:hypothetical protein